jgi:hypothetical protein
VFDRGKPFQPYLYSWVRLGAYPKREHPKGVSLPNVRLDCKALPGTNKPGLFGPFVIYAVTPIKEILSSLVYVVGKARSLPGGKHLKGARDKHSSSLIAITAVKSFTASRPDGQPQDRRPAKPTQPAPPP